MLELPSFERVGPANCDPEFVFRMFRAVHTDTGNGCKIPVDFKEASKNTHSLSYDTYIHLTNNWLMAQQQTSTNNPSTSASSNTNVSNLYPQLESVTANLDESERNLSIVKIEKELVACLKEAWQANDILEDVVDRSIVPTELISAKKLSRPKIDPLQRLKELPTEEPEEDEEQEDEEDEEEQEIVEDEEEDAGGDYLVSHFDNGENFEENDDEDDDMVVN